MTKKLLLLVAIALAFAMTALAQETGAAGQAGASTTTTTTSKSTTKSTTKSKKGKAAAGAAKTHQLTGCLEKDAAGTGYMLTNARHKKGVEVKSSEDISAHVGHKVQLTGDWEGAGAEKTFNATALKHISDTCTAGAAKGGKGKAKGAAPTGTSGEAGGTKTP